MKLENLQRVDRKAQSAGRADLPVVITRQCYGLALLLDKVHRREMKGVERSDRLGKRLQSTRQDRQRELDKRDPSQQSSHFVAMGSGRAYARGCASKSRTRSADWNSKSLARALQAGRGLQREDARAPPMYRDRSTLAPVVLQFALEFAEGHHRVARRHASSRQRRRSYPTLAHGLRQHGVGD